MSIATRITSHIERFENQYFYSSLVGTYLIHLPKLVLLFDLPTYSSDIKKYLESFGKPIKSLLSHGSCGIPDGSRWQSELDIEIYLHKADENHSWLRIKPDVLFQTVPHFASNIQIIHAPGHSPGSVCLIESTSKTLFTGDTIGGTSEGQIRDYNHDDVPTNLQTCQRLLNLDFKHVLPFHYSAIMNTGKEALKQYLRLKGNNK